MTQTDDPVDSPSLSLFKEWVYQRSEQFDAARLPNDPYLNLDRATLLKVCRELPASELASGLLYAVYLGDVTLAEDLWSERGPFKIHLVETATNQLELNGEAYTRPTDRLYLFEAIRTADQLKAMFDLLDHPDIIGLLDDAGALFQKGLMKPVAEIARAVEFDGNLPTLSGETVSDPELMVALNEMANGRQHPKPYNPILCWATPEMVEAYGEYLDPYVPVHGATLGDQFVDFETWRALHTKAETEASEPPSCDALTLQFKASRNDLLGQVVMQAYGNKKQKHGIFEKTGYLLCHTSCAFLAEFERPVELDSRNYALARAFTHHYVPFDLMTLNAHPGGDRNCPAELGFHYATRVKALAFMRIGEDIHQALGPVLSHSQWKFILKDDWLVGQDIVTAVKVFGLDNQAMVWRLEQETPGDLKDLGYRFVPQTEVFLQDKKGVTSRDRLNTGATCVDLSEIKTFCRRTDINDVGTRWGRCMLQNTYEIGLWPFKEPKRPLSKLIRGLARTQTPTDDLSDMASIARVIIKDSPIEECVKHAKTASEWTLLAVIHGPEVMQPYLRVMPLTSRGVVFSQDLGI
ncbi:hypothetical protein [Pseudomonas serbica]|uniref:hypothetical protein n=1 Tax=Pseudomonas serbica TaxID=2965074 RepID=UPI00237BA080|nr:hypothetical protein [Pseudomonas serbica]